VDTKRIIAVCLAASLLAPVIGLRRIRTPTDRTRRSCKGLGHYGSHQDQAGRRTIRQSGAPEGGHR